MLIYLFSVLSHLAFAANSEMTLRYYVNNAYTQVKTQKVDQVRVNDVCVTKKNCKALTAVKSKPFKIQPTKAPFVGNPGANYCWDAGAKNRVLKDQSNNQYDFCVFDDGSMVDAWDLYKAHYPPNVIK
ncbi:DUF333 domain-containing protein [Bdellovibrio sp. 22V]|uniref:DUF333 domain-containing protein n=1 Tax=Bdellovibrio TaxID=958 RepID=UPI0025432464|nr:DUF333 domain-containing protein [Bdellovibrio sp. 22V]WII73879.1 DUF333 domain-containing protein [Bdellovibrio sp. 22V]